MKSDLSAAERNARAELLDLLERERARELNALKEENATLKRQLADLKDGFARYVILSVDWHPSNNAQPGRA
jgi:cell division protein FtsB